ncbi:hypothetical protein [Nocardia alni]|uniref:hypothetical protein n=1 Tax=Nocardia alni TaxID=2815723 RepID=UPI001C240871|nr:hypothetical protein [Nocardia alni]
MTKPAEIQSEATELDYDNLLARTLEEMEAQEVTLPGDIDDMRRGAYGDVWYIAYRTFIDDQPR